MMILLLYHQAQRLSFRFIRRIRGTSPAGRRNVPGVDFQAVRSRVPMREVLALIGFVPREICGEQLRGPCPVHGSSSATSRSFSVNLRRNAYRCFKCGSSGNQLDLWAALSKTDLHSAAVDLCQRLQTDIPWIRDR
jgi:DNA primase